MSVYKQPFIDITKVLASCQAAWLSDFLQLDSDDWDDVWNSSFSRMVSARITWYTPAKLARIFPVHLSNYWRCANPGRIFCTFSGIAHRSSSFGLCQVSYNNYHQTYHSSLSVGTCRPVGTKKGDLYTTYAVLLYYAHKILSWKKLVAPIIVAWKAFINTATLYKAT